MDETTRIAFVAHVQELERRSIAGDIDATKSLACMVLLAEGWRSHDPNGGEVGDLSQYRMVA